MQSHSELPARLGLEAGCGKARGTSDLVPGQSALSSSSQPLLPGARATATSSLSPAGARWLPTQAGARISSMFPCLSQQARGARVSVTRLLRECRSRSRR